MKLSGNINLSFFPVGIYFNSLSILLRDQSNSIGQDDGILDSMDKYKHLEETAFKRSFMDILSQNIQSKLEKAVRHNMVRIRCFLLSTRLTFFFFIMRVPNSVFR